jgi:hypothetical protein
VRRSAHSKQVVPTLGIELNFVPIVFTSESGLTETISPGSLGLWTDRVTLMRLKICLLPGITFRFCAKGSLSTYTSLIPSRIFQRRQAPYSLSHFCDNHRETDKDLPEITCHFCPSLCPIHYAVSVTLSDVVQSRFTWLSQ